MVVKVNQPDAIAEVKAKELNGHANEPIFSFASFGLMDQLRFTDMQSELMETDRLGRQIREMARDNPDAEVDPEIEERLRNANTLNREVVEMVMKTVRTVPPGWLVEDAPEPEEINWKNKTHWNYLRGDQLPKLMTAFQFALAGRFAPGN